MKKKLAIMFLLLFALAFAFGALATTANAIVNPPPGCWWECDNGFIKLCCPLPGECGPFHFPPISC